MMGLWDVLFLSLWAPLLVVPWLVIGRWCAPRLNTVIVFGLMGVGTAAWTVGFALVIWETGLVRLAVAVLSLISCGPGGAECDY